MQFSEELNDAVYAFFIYTNPNTHVKYLLFKGVGLIENNKINILHKYDYLHTQYNFQKLRNYYDMVNKFGEKPCRLVDNDLNIVSDKEYENQNEIAKEFNIKISRLSKRAFNEKDVVSSKMGKSKKQ